MASLLPGTGGTPAERPPDTRASSPAAPGEPLSLKAYRDALVAAIETEDRDSARIVGLLQTATPWSAWPERFRRALMAAVTEEGTGMEARKARVLRGQLFRDVDPGWPPLLPSTLPPAERCLVERLRMDLLGRTPLGCGWRLRLDTAVGHPS